MCFKAARVNLSALLAGDNARVIKKARLILANPGHHLTSELVCFLLIFPRCTTERFKNSFVSLAVGLQNTCIMCEPCVLLVSTACISLCFTAACATNCPSGTISSTKPNQTEPNQTRWLFHIVQRFSL